MNKIIKTIVTTRDTDYSFLQVVIENGNRTLSLFENYGPEYDQCVNLFKHNNVDLDIGSSVTDNHFE